MLTVEQLYTSCLAEACYFVSDHGEVAVIDPLRDPEPYLAKAKAGGQTIKYIFETHYHADFISGYKDLSRRTGAVVIFGPNAAANETDNIAVAKDGQTFQLGQSTFKVLHTPGHTLESSCFLLFDGTDDPDAEDDHGVSHQPTVLEGSAAAAASSSCSSSCGAAAPGSSTVTTVTTFGHASDNNDKNDNKTKKVWPLRDVSHKKPVCVFTGDTLFIGDVGRPDLAIKSTLTSEDLAGMLYDSLMGKLVPLPDDVIVYPAHGAGSSCGKNLSSKTWSTIGEQKQTNYALNCRDKADFVRQLLEGIAPPPQYFAKDAALNRSGDVAPFEEVLRRGRRPLTVAEFEAAAADKAVLVLDVRDRADYAAGHVAGSVFVGMDGQLALNAGAVIASLQQPIVLVCQPEQESIAIVRLSRVGYDNVFGFLSGGFAAWTAAGKPVAKLPEVTAAELEAVLRSTEAATNAVIIDVRRPAEFRGGHVRDAQLATMEYLSDHVDKLPRAETGKTLYLYCKSGYRSVIVASLLAKRGFTNLVNVKGGYEEIVKAHGIEIDDGTAHVAKKARLDN